MYTAALKINVLNDILQSVVYQVGSKVLLPNPDVTRGLKSHRHVHAADNPNTFTDRMNDLITFLFFAEIYKKDEES